MVVLSNLFCKHGCPPALTHAVERDDGLPDFCEPRKTTKVIRHNEGGGIAG